MIRLFTLCSFFGFSIFASVGSQLDIVIARDAWRDFSNSVSPEYVTFNHDVNIPNAIKSNNIYVFETSFLINSNIMLVSDTSKPKWPLKKPHRFNIEGYLEVRAISDTTKEIFNAMTRATETRQAENLGGTDFITVHRISPEESVSCSKHFSKGSKDRYECTFHAILAVGQNIGG